LPAMSTFITVISLALFVSVFGHGYITVPPPRWSVLGLNPMISENGPVPNALDNAFVCRNEQGSAPRTTVTAGQTVDLKWVINARHVGDCNFYISYDGNTTDATKMKWFRFAEMYDCKKYMTGNGTPLYIPEYLPNCEHCVLRWEWYAIHLFPSVEFFSQCIDIKIQGCNGGSVPTPLVTMPGHIPNEGAYRNPWGASNIEGVTGPKMATPANRPSNCPEGDNVNKKYAYQGGGQGNNPTPQPQPTSQPDPQPQPGPNGGGSAGSACDTAGQYACGSNKDIVICGADHKWVQIAACGAGCSLINSVPFCS